MSPFATARVNRYLRSRWRHWFKAKVRPRLNRLFAYTDAWGLTSPGLVYPSRYYGMRTRDPHLRDAREVAGAVHDEFQPNSVIDLGCAVGHYLLLFRDRGVEVHGVDGHPAALEHAVIPAGNLELADLREPYDPPQRFDVALCIEVAEHLAPRYADKLVDTLTAAAPVVVFTAAPPGQGGTHHVNEQSRAYWKERFADRGYGYDGETTGRLRAGMDLQKVTHVADNLFVFREGAA